MEEVQRPVAGMNHAQFQERLDFVHAILDKKFGLKAQTVSPVEYDPHWAVPYNNFIYLIRLARPLAQGAPTRPPSLHPFARPGSVSVTSRPRNPSPLGPRTFGQPILHSNAPRNPEVYSRGRHPIVRSSPSPRASSNVISTQESSSIARSPSKSTSAQATSRASNPHSKITKPFTRPIPPNVDRLILRLSNPAANLNSKTHVENQVALMDLTGDAINSYIESHRGALTPKHIVPVTYGWGTAAKGRGWILQEYMPGLPLSQIFEDLDLEQKRLALHQIAEIVGALQRYELPGMIEEFGGITIKQDGKLLSAPMSTLDCGPFKTYKDVWLEVLRLKLRKADRSEIIKGWTSNGIRSRLDNFISFCVPQLVDNVVHDRKIIVHGDITLSNILFDKSTNLVTAILDFDHARIAPAGEEFLSSFRSIGGCLPAPFGQSIQSLTLRTKMLHGFSDPPNEQLQLAALWDSCLAQLAAQKPSNIQGIDALSGIHWLSDHICPSMLCEPTAVKQGIHEELHQHRAHVEQLLDRYLFGQGY